MAAVVTVISMFVSRDIAVTGEFLCSRQHLKGVQG